MLALRYVAIWLLSYGRELLFIIRQGFRNARRDNGESERFFLFYLFVSVSLTNKRMMDVNGLGKRLRLIRKHLGISQQQLAKATNLTQPAISRLENGEEVYASALLAMLDFYRKKVSLDHLFDPDLDISDNTMLYCNRQERRQMHDRQLADLARSLEKSLEQIITLREDLI